MKFWYHWEGLWWWSLLTRSLGGRITSEKGESREWRDLYSFNVIHENSPPGEWNLCNDPPCYASIAEYTSASISTDNLIIESYRPPTIRRIGEEYHGCQCRDQKPRQRNMLEKRNPIQIQFTVQFMFKKFMETWIICSKTPLHQSLQLFPTMIPKYPLFH